jgi:hypothetical protein
VEEETKKFPVSEFLSVSTLRLCTKLKFFRKIYSSEASRVHDTSKVISCSWMIPCTEEVFADAIVGVRMEIFRCTFKSFYFQNKLVF